MLMHAIPNGGCSDTVREESALEVDSGRKRKKERKKERKKSLATPGTRTRRQYYAWLFSEKLYPLSYSLKLNCLDGERISCGVKMRRETVPDSRGKGLGDVR